MKPKDDFQTSAIFRAARGMLSNKDMDEQNRVSSMYGFQDRALHLSGEDIKNAWKSASSSIRKSRG
ncbi:hypothetical protein [Vibrio cholerae]|uniref:hypothetical protein n=1 Tax=Vibrio cholerae TaxID=666 RepID=UPI000E0C3BA2|nr:hypothetical protein [Vibrio cholerae]EJL6307599.1 hypothetical protein [Vibrio cholerae]EJL6759338.1 hypothetical protein [Vibrio cholerae]ELH0845007.1 hypothetical protein [Vibrio cholerae]